MLTFIGLGLFDEKDVSLRGAAAIRTADTVFLEVYTSVLMGASIEKLEQFYGKKIIPLNREDVEQHPELILDAASTGNAVFLTGGDSMVATTLNIPPILRNKFNKPKSSGEYIRVKIG